MHVVFVYHKPLKNEFKIYFLQKTFFYRKEKIILGPSNGNNCFYQVKSICFKINLTTHSPLLQVPFEGNSQMFQQ